MERHNAWERDHKPKLLSEIIRQTPNPNWREGSDQPETIPKTERLEDYPEVKQAWDRYIQDKWLPWTKEHAAWKRVHRVYSTLFAIYQMQLRLGEEYELVLGLGLLTWQTPTEPRVRRHLIVADAFLEFEAHLGKFIVRPHAEGAKLRPELDMLEINEQLSDAEKNASNALSQAEDNPWERGCVESVLNALVHSINPQGEYSNTLKANVAFAPEQPIVEYAPALILRERSTKGLIKTLERIKEQIESGERIPCGFAELAEIHPRDNSYLGDEPGDANAAFDNDIFDGEIFFPLSSNEEQRRIVEKIQEAKGVLVQGPPGTGKSHTIANLICHLLATGKRILITAKTSHALQVLYKKHLPTELRPLCINLLGSGREGHNALETSVRGILHKAENWIEEHADQDRMDNEDRLNTLRGEESRN